MELFVGRSSYPDYVYDTSTPQLNDITEILNFPNIRNVQDATFADFNGDLIPRCVSGMWCLSLLH